MTPTDEELGKRAREQMENVLRIDGAPVEMYTELHELDERLRQLAGRVEALGSRNTELESLVRTTEGCESDLRELHDEREQIWRPLVEAGEKVKKNFYLKRLSSQREIREFSASLDKGRAALPPKDSAHTVTMREDSVTPKQDVEVRFRPPKDEGPTIPSIPPMTVEPAADFDPTLEPPKGEDLCVCGHDVEDHNDIWKKATHCHKCGCQVWRAKTEDEGGIVLDGRREEWQNEQ